MNTGFVLGAAFGQSFAGVLIMFALSALALQSQRKAKLGWKKTLLFFLIALAVLTAINIALFFSNPSLLTNNEESVFGIFHTFGLPLIVSAGTLLLLWKPNSS
jgi:hypothetical protein